MHHLELVLEQSNKVGLKLKPAKCQLLRWEVEYLGHTITPLGLKAGDRHGSVINQFPTPTNVREVKKNFGMASYIGQFIPSFSKIANFLHTLTRKDVQIQVDPGREATTHSICKSSAHTR